MKELWRSVPEKSHIMSPVANYSNAIEMSALLAKMSVGSSGIIQRLISVFYENREKDSIPLKILEPVVHDAF